MRTKKRAKSVTFTRPKPEAAPKEVEAEVKKKAAEVEKEEKKVTAHADVKAASTSNVAEANAVEKEDSKDATSDVAVKEKKKEETPEEHKGEELEKEEATTLKTDGESSASDKAEAETAVEKKNEAEKNEEATVEVETEEKEALKDLDKKDSDEQKEQDPLEKDLESLKEPTSTNVVENDVKNEIASTVTVENNKEEKEPKEEKTEAKKEDTNPFIVKDSAFSRVDGLYDKKKKNPAPFFLLVAGAAFVLGLAVMAGAEYLLKESNIKLPNVANMAANQPSPTPEPSSSLDSSLAAEEEVAPIEVPEEADLSAFSIRVLNGSGVKGEAARVKTALTTAGFTVTGTGNADMNDYKKTQILAKKEVDQAYLKHLEAELGKTYVLDKVSTPDAAQAADVVVIIGSSTK